ncbi:glycerophosphodiester phosphodiesterase [Aliifodinibius salipaludis]|uniref:Glycerophosphodiester phosphodiesterase n=1 Tax=Fodinibius salipaludis TaxID=2032627 RepID=A0A2A2G7E4_9BACT|nr:glycerophosphodiester phosphodiesterase family protein [Aliifodinibius salipaludis]PAU92747.1 glycerophosphodiester phosphodiesterase [Aliifodinibius salipaludis]
MKVLKYAVLIALIATAGCGQSEVETTPELIGHRGATGLAPENTISGFKKALDYNVDAIELDVVISGDDRVVVSHEPWFRHDICLTPEGDSISADSQKDHLIYKMEYDQIAEYDCGSVQRKGYPDQENQPLAKPLLTEVIREVEDHIDENNLKRIGYKVEIKSKSAWYEDNEIQPTPEQAAELVHEVLVEKGIIDRVDIFAFNPRILDKFEEIDSSIPRVFLIPKSKTDVGKNLSALNSLPDIYATNYEIVDSSLVEQIHNKDMQLYAWTVNTYEDMVELVNVGVDGIISDYPNYYKKLRAQ